MNAQSQIDTRALEISRSALTKIESHEAMCEVKHEAVQASLTRIEAQGKALLGLLIAGLLAIIAAFVQRGL